MNILIVDDNYDFRMTVEEYFKSCGYHTHNAANGLEALDIMDAAKVQLAILDLSMPAMNGYETLEYMSAHYPKTNVVIITGSDNVNKMDLFEHGVLFVEQKPLDMVELELKIRNFQQAIYKVQTMTIPYQTGIEHDINRVYDLILEEIDNYHLNVDYLASRLDVSKKMLYARINELLTISVHDMIKYVRLLKAHELIHSGKAASIKEVSNKVGYKDSGYFSRLYRQNFGVNLIDLIRNGGTSRAVSTKKRWM